MADISGGAVAMAELVRRLCLAESLGRIYSVNHPKGQTAVRSAFEAVAPVVEEAGTLAVSMAEGRILVNGQVVEERNPAVGRFINALQQIHVDNLVFSRGVSGAEFEDFFRVLLQGAKVVNAGGGLAAILKDKGISHIKSQQVTFMMVRDEEAAAKHETQPIEPPAAPPALSDEQLLRHTMREVAEKAKPRKPRKPRARKPVVDAISQSLRERGVADEQSAELAAQLGEYFERELGARTRELKDENRRLTDEVRDLNRVLEQMDLAVLVWNPQGVVTFVHHSAVTMLGLIAGRSLSPGVHECLKTLSFPLLAPEETLAARGDLAERDTILLRAVEGIIKGPDGAPIAALLRRG